MHGLYPPLLLEQDEFFAGGRAEVALPVEDEGPRLEVLQPAQGVQVDPDGQLMQFLALFCEVLDHFEARVVCF